MKRVLVMALLMAGSAGLEAGQIQQKAGGENRALGPTESVRAVQGSGEVRQVDSDGIHVILSHGPIPELGWPAQGRHRLAVFDPALLQGVRPGQRVRFTVNDRGIIIVLDVLP